MKKISFYRWLYLQRKRDDSVGDLARDVHDEFPDLGECKLQSLKSVWIAHLERHGACTGAFRALDRAWKEYRDRRIQFKLATTLRVRLYQALKKNKKVGSHVKDLGCTLEELKIHLEKQFKEGMTWKNWSKDGWHVDHIKPLARFDLTKREQFLEVCHYLNLQPLWAKENISKGKKLITNVQKL